MKVQLGRLLASVFLLSSTLGQAYLCQSSAGAETLKGEVKEKTVNQGGSSRLQRNQTDPNADPFGSGDQGQAGATSPNSHQSETTDTFSVTPEPFRMENDGGNRRSAAGVGRSQPGGNQPAPSASRAGGGANGGRAPVHTTRGTAPGSGLGTADDALRSAVPTTDPDRSPHMLLAWDAWHQAVANGIYMRFNKAAHSKFGGSTPLLCKVGYVVSRDRQIQNVHILQASANARFDDLVVSAVKSMANNPSLEFPRHSQRQSVERSGTFTLNQKASAGYQFQKGDREQIGN